MSEFDSEFDDEENLSDNGVEINFIGVCIYIKTKLFYLYYQFIIFFYSGVCGGTE